MAELSISYSCLSKNGGRDINEDYLDVSIMPERLAFILCDGLGGHGNGDIASQFVTETLKNSLEKSEGLENSILTAQKGLLQLQRENNVVNSMKTTLTCLTLEKDTAKFGYVGDSRIYCFDKGKYRLRSQDHSVPQMLAARGLIQETEIRFHEDRSKLLRVMGTEWDAPKYQIVDNIPLSSHLSFLLCSDGFWELIDEKQMVKTLKKSESPQQWLEYMEAIILQNGQNTEMDNYSAIAVFLR